MGLLDKIGGFGGNPNDPDFLQKQGLVGLGAGLLGSSGWSDRPVSLGQAFGQGLQGMQAARGNAQNVLLAKQKENRLKSQADMMNQIYGTMFPQGGETSGEPGAPKIPLGMSIQIGPQGPTIAYDPVAAANARRAQEKARDVGVGTIGVSPEEQRKIAAQKEKARVEAEMKIPDAALQVEKTTKDVNTLLEHPGLEGSFGWRSAVPAAPGTDRADFEAKLQKLQSTVFIENRDKLKGGGSITDYEGRQAAEAEVAMAQAQTAEQFREGLKDYLYWVNRGFDNLKRKAGQAAPGSGWSAKVK